jgi:hypothetical protein
MEGPLILDVLEALAPGEAGPPRLVLDLQTVKTNRLLARYSN